MVSKKSSISSNGAFSLNSLGRRLQLLEPTLEDLQSTARNGASWVIPESDDDDAAIDADDAPIERPNRTSELARVPSVLRAGAGRGSNRSRGALHYLRRPRPYNAIIEELQDRLHAELRAKRDGAAGPLVSDRPLVPGRVRKRPSPTAAERARRRAIERNIRGVANPPRDDGRPEDEALTVEGAASINSRQSRSDRVGPPPARFARFERVLRDELRTGDYDEEAIRYYLDLISQHDGHYYGGSRTAEFSDLDIILADDARPGPEGQIRRDWKPMKTLGKGSYGEVMLWQRITRIGMVRLMPLRKESLS